MNSTRRHFMRRSSAMLVLSMGSSLPLLQACGGGNEADSNDASTPAETALLHHLTLVSSGRIQEWVDLFTPDGILEFPYAPTGVPRRLQGRDELLGYMIHFPETFDVKFADLVFHRMKSPTLAIAEFRLTGHVIPTGKPYEQVCISVLSTSVEGKIQHYNDYWNPLIAIEALTPATS